MIVSIGLDQQLRCNILLPLVLGITAILIATLYPLNSSVDSWESTTYDYLYDTSISATETRLTYMKKYFNEYFDVTKNNINVIHDYIQQSAGDDLNVETNYQNYFSVNTFNSEIPPKDFDDYYFSSASFLKNINTVHDLSLVDSYSLNKSTIFDNVFRATFKSTNLYTTMYFGFELNGLHRRYPYADLTSFTTYIDVCYYNNQPITTYDPRCREWYVTAKYDDKIHYTSPYRSSLTGQTTITASKRVLNGTNLLGVIGIDFLMQEIDNIISNNKIMDSGYMFLMSFDGSIISYPNLDRTLATSTVILTESGISANVWYDILNDKNENPLFKSVQNYGKTWILTYVYLPDTEYYVVMMYPESDVENTESSIFNSINKEILVGTTVLPIIAGITVLIAILVLNTAGKKYTEPINQLLRDVKQIGTASLDIELGDRAPVSSEFTALTHNFKNLLTAVKFGNDAYYDGNMQKALESYENAEKLMTTLNVKRGLSVCYNNKANVYKQMGNFVEAEKFYLQSIKLVQTLMNDASDQSTINAYKVAMSYKLMNLGVLYKDTKQIQKALEHFEESIKLARETDNSLGISKIAGNLAQLYLENYSNDKQKIVEARELVYGAHETIKNKSDEISLQYSLMNIGLYEMHVKNYELALSAFTNVLKEYETVDMYVKQICIKNVKELLILLGRTDEARQIESQQIIVNVSNNVLFALDCSGSMAGQFINTCKSSIKNVIADYLQEIDNISMIVFNSQVIPVFDNQTKQNQQYINSLIDKIKADGGTAFYDALYDAIKKVENSSSATGIKWIVALTDGDDQHSKKKPEDLIKILKGTSVNLILMTVGKLQNYSILQNICKNVGNGAKGILIEIDKNPQEINKAFAKVAKLIIGQLNVESL